MGLDTLSLGFIGGGINSAVGTTHKIAAQMDGRWRLVAGCFSKNKDKNIDTAKAWGINKNRVYDDWRQLLNKEKGKLDAVVILAPTPDHKEIAINAIEHGFAVICEKALASSSSDAELIKKSIDENNGFLAVTYNYTGYPMVRELKMMIEEGKLGKLKQIHIEMPQEGFIKLNKDNTSPIPQEWRLKDTEIPTIALDLGVHLHQMIHFLSKESPLELVAINDCYGSFDNVIDNTMCIARYTENLSCQIWYSKCALGNRNGLRVRVYGDQGAAEWYQMEPEYLNYTDKYGTQRLIDRSTVFATLSSELRYNRFKAGHPSGFIEAFANLYYDLADGLIEFKTSKKSNSKWIFMVNDAIEGLKMLEAMTVSAKTKSWVKIC